MEVNPASTPKIPASGQSTTGQARSARVATAAPDHGPALKIESSSTASSSLPDSPAANADAISVNADDLKKAETLRALISDQSMQLRTYHDEASGRSVLEVSDQKTGKVVSQYPSDELLRLYAALREPLVDQSA